MHLLQTGNAFWLSITVILGKSVVRQQTQAGETTFYGPACTGLIWPTLIYCTNMHMQEYKII